MITSLIFFDALDLAFITRSNVQLPAHLRHANPTKGDWLEKRYIVNNYILLDVLGSGSYGEVLLFHALIQL